MNEKTIKVKVFKFKELSEDVQDKVIEDFSDININYDWWDYLHDDFKEDLEEIGLKAETFYWSIDRDSHFYSPDIQVVDEKKFLKYAGWDLRSKQARDIIDYDGLSIGVHHYGGGSAANFVEYDYLGNNELTDVLRQKYEDFLSLLSKQWDYLTSREAIEETIIINEYDFLEDGSRSIYL